LKPIEGEAPMYQNLTLFRVSGAAASHAASRQAQVATNIANADTPGYKARAIAPFGETYRAGSASQLRATRLGHLSLSANSGAARPQPGGGEPSPNGNTVSLEEEMVNSVEVEREHSRALAIYRHGLDILRIAVGR